MNLEEKKTEKPITLSFHTIYESSITDAIQKATMYGFSGIQLAVELPHIWQQLDNPVKLQKIRSLADEHNISLNLHGFDYITSLYLNEKTLITGIFQYFHKLFSWAKTLNSQLITLHLGLVPTYPKSKSKKNPYTDEISLDESLHIPDESKEIYRMNLSQNLEKLISMNTGISKICIENYGFNEITYQILKPYLQQDKIGLCWDIPKTFQKNGSLNKQMYSFIMQNAPNVNQIHLHDFHPQLGSHLELGRGILPQNYLFLDKELSQLEDICFEVRPFEKAHKSKEKFEKNKQEMKKSV